MELFRIEFEGEEFDEYIVISNKSKKTGKPRRIKINSQDMYVGMDHHLRSKIVKEIKKRLYTKIRPVSVVNPTSYPIRIDVEIHYPVGDWDMGNKLYLWRKCFEDALCGNVDFYSREVPTTTATAKNKFKTIYEPMRDKYPEKIEDDSVRYLTGYGEQYTSIADLKDRKLTFIISTN